MSRWAGRFASTLLVALSLTGPARASPSRVVVVQSANESQIVNQRRCASAPSSRPAGSRWRAVKPGPVTIDLGAAVIDHLDDNPPSLGPELRLAHHVAPTWILALDVVGPAFTWSRRRSAGEITPREELAVVSFVSAAGASGQLEVAPGVALHFGARALFALPGALYRIAGEDVGRIGRVSFLSSLGVVVTP